jgi:hypothetical protein
MKSSFSLLLGLVTCTYVALAGTSMVGTSVRAYGSGPDPAVTGGFNETTCNQSGCHNSYDTNAGRASKLGDIVIEGLPKQYEPGKTYPVKVIVTHMEGRMYWGFELASRVKDGGTQAGTLMPADDKTQIVEEKGIQYIEHTLDGIEANTFTFNWTAPAKPAGEIVFDAAGNAADGDGSAMGDYIYTTSVAVSQ